MVAHTQEQEYYINISSVREGDWILFSHEGGVDIGDAEAKSEKILIPVDLAEYPSNDRIAEALLKNVPKGIHNVLVDFISRLYAGESRPEKLESQELKFDVQVYVQCQFSLLEINPLVVIANQEGTSAKVFFLDLAAKLDQTVGIFARPTLTIVSS